MRRYGLVVGTTLSYPLVWTHWTKYYARLEVGAHAERKDFEVRKLGRMCSVVGVA